MREREPAIQTIKASEAREQFSQLLNKVFRREARVIVEKSGVPVAAIVSAEDLRQLARFEAQQEERFAILDRMRAPFRDVPPEEIEREVARAIDEVRQENRGHDERDRSIP